MARIKLQTTQSVLEVGVFGSVGCTAERCDPEPSSFLMGDFMRDDACPTTPSKEGLSAEAGFGDTLQIFCQNVADQKSVRMTAKVCHPTGE